MRVGALAAVTLATAMACGSDATPPPAQPTSAPTATAAATAPAPQHLIPEPTRVPSPKLLDRRARSAIAPDTLASVKSVSSVPKDAATIYRKVAPATVVVRTEGGIASGVIIDPAGWVLTNHHVVAQGTSEDFRTKVEVIVGRVDPKSRQMSLGDQSYEAHVYKIDWLRDLALVKIAVPPKDLPSLPIATKDPVAGQPVFSVGHAGSGQLWSIQAGEISGLSQLAEHLGAMVKFSDDAAGKDSAVRFAAYLKAQNLGLVIQSSCDLLPGAGGGPLVDAKGQLVGLNGYSQLDSKTGEFVNHHAHRADIAKFVEEKPRERAYLVPDPWLEGGGDAAYEDANGDGAVDVLMLKGRRPCRFCARQSLALFVDIDQDSFADTVQLPSLPEVYEKRAFDAELVFLRIEEDSLVWYDTDNDGDFDVLLLDQGTTGRSTHAYRIRANGRVDRWATLAQGAIVRLSLFRDSGLRVRLGPIGKVAFPSDFVEATTGWQGALPNPLGRAGDATVADLNRDGVNDAVTVRSPFGSRLLVDSDQNWVRNLKEHFELADVVQLDSVDPEMTIVSQGTYMWFWYDTNDDKRFDLVLHSPGSRLYVAADAYRVEVPGGLKPAPEHVGRKLVRPALMIQPAHAQGLRSMVEKRSFLDLMSTVDDSGLTTFPDPVLDHRGTGFTFLKLVGGFRAVLSLQGQGSDGYLIDLDGVGLEGKVRGHVELAKAVRDGRFDAEFAYFHRNGLAWAYYDTDNQGGYDVVLYTAQPHAGIAAQGFRIDAEGKVTLDPELGKKPMVRPSLVANKGQRDRLRKLGGQVFADQLIEPKPKKK